MGIGNEDNISILRERLEKHIEACTTIYGIIDDYEKISNRLAATKNLKSEILNDIDYSDFKETWNQLSEAITSTALIHEGRNPA